MSERFRGDPSEHSPDINKNKSADSLRASSEIAISLGCEDFTVEGRENLQEIRRIQAEQPDSRFIVSASHISNLDGPAAVKALGEDLNIEMAVDSTHFAQLDQRIMHWLAGKENFTGIKYARSKEGKKSPVFDPQNFTELEEKMQAGKTPWMAAHNLSITGKMRKASIGSIYLAQKTGAHIIPAALELKGGGSVSFEGAQEIAKGVIQKAEAIYHIGKPIKLEPVDISIIESVLNKRKAGEKITENELELYGVAHESLKRQAEQIEQAISEMLPESMRRKEN